MSAPLNASSGLRAVTDRHGRVTTRDHILTVLHRGGEWSNAELTGLLGVSEYTTRRALSALCRSGVVVKVPGPLCSNGRFFSIRWALAGGDSDV